VCYFWEITFAFYGTSAILRCDPFMVSRKSSSSYMVFSEALILSKSSLKVGLLLIALMASSR
jgi:hypothetical protein